MNSTKIHLVALVMVLVMLVSACTLLQSAQPSIPDPGALYTQAAQTIVAQLTLAAGDITSTPTSLTATDTSVPATETPEPSATQTEMPTNTPTASPVPPTSTPAPTNPPTRPPTATPVPCLWARFVEDVTVAE